MRKRLQVIMSDGELDELRRTAARHGTTVSEWVRQAIRRAGRKEASGAPYNTHFRQGTSTSCSVISSGVPWRVIFVDANIPMYP